MTDRATELREQGRDIISLSVGEPDFATPAHVIEAAKAALDAGDTKYTPVTGTARLKQAAALHFERDLGIEADPTNVIVSAGGKQAIFEALAATVSEGDEVIVPSPWWVSYPQIVRFCGGQGRAADHPRRTTTSTSIPADVEALIGPRTQWLMLNSPGNPTGAVYPERHAARHRRSAAPPSARAGAERRHLFAADLHRRSRMPRWPTCAPTSPTASAPSRASPRATR